MMVETFLIYVKLYINNGDYTYINDKFVCKKIGNYILIIVNFSYIHDKFGEKIFHALLIILTHL